MMERLGKIDKRNIYYFRWDDEKREYYLENFPKRKWALFVIGAGRLDEDYKLLAEKSVVENLIFMSSAGDECELIHDIFDRVVIQKVKDSGADMDAPDIFEDTAMTVWNTNKFDWGYWAATIDDYCDEKVKILICVDFTKRGVRKYLLRLTKMIRKRWLPPSGPKGTLTFNEPLYDDEIKKPLRKSQKGFEKH